MSEIKVNSIKGVAASSAALTINNTDGTCTANITNNLSNRNLIINGAMQVAQRGTSSTGTDYKTVDRFRCEFAGTDENPTQSQHGLTSSDTGVFEKGFRNSYHIQNGDQTGGAGAADDIHIEYRIEAQDISNSGWDYKSSSSFLTLSFWVKSSVAQNFYGFAQAVNATKRFPFETGSLTADTWTKVTKTIQGDSGLSFNTDTSAGLILNWVLYYGTNLTGSVTLNQWMALDNSNKTPNSTSTWYEADNATFEITGVQLEVGSVATDFEHRSYGQELALCQRYYYRETIQNAEYFNGLGKADSDGNSIDLNLKFPVTMRTTPSAVEQTGDGNNYLIRGSSTLQCTGVPTYGDATQHSATIRFTRSSHSISTNNVANCGSWGGSYLGFSAEL